MLLSQEEKQKRKERCRFILEQGDQILAANYLIYEGSFLYSQAIRDHFFPSLHSAGEDEAREIEFAELLEKICKTGCGDVFSDLGLVSGTVSALCLV